MTLRGFHILFVGMATALSLAFGWWAFEGYRASESAGYAWAAGGAAVSSVALVIYGVAVYRKLGRLDIA